MLGKDKARKAQMAHPHRLALAMLAGALGSAAEPASAQQIPASVRADERVEFDIPAQSLSSALSEFARQAGVNALYFSDDLRSRSAPTINGAYTREEALNRLLEGSGYSGRISGANLVLVQDAPRPQRESAASSGAESDEDEPGAADGEEEIVVTGTRIRGAAPVGANVQTLDRDDIDQTGRSTLQDVLQVLPQNFPGSQTELSQQAALDARRNIAFGSTVDLRGLGADATLSLVNGRRLAPAGFGNFVDISGVPLAAVERIEILPDGASATYGADAVGGVVNVILRRDFDGAESALRYGAGDSLGEWGASQLFGTDWGSGNAMIAYEYRARDALGSADRAYTADSDLRRYGGSNFSRTGANPGNIIRVGAATVTIPIPAGQDGTDLTQSELVSGPLNLANNNEGSDLLPEQTSHSLFAAFRQDLSPSIEIFADMLFSRREASADRVQLSGNLVVPQTNAYRQLNNLFPGAGNLTIAYWMGEDLGPIVSETQTESLSAFAGMRFALPREWQAEAGIGLARHVDDSATLNTFQSDGAIIAALASSNLDTAFNPFGDGANTNAAVLDNLTFDSFTLNDSEIVSASIKADGPLFRLWGGDLRAAIGAETRTETFSIDRVQYRFAGPTVQFIQDPGERTTHAVFAELYAPLIGPDNNIPFVNELTISVSARYEEPDDFESSVTPRYGIRWGVTPDFTFRAAWGESFKAPQFQQMLGGSAGTRATFTAAQDPLATNGSTGALTVAGSNRDLLPERADTWTAGFNYRPSWLDGFSFDAAYFDIDFSGRIASPGSTLNAIRNPVGLESVLIRNPTQAQIDYYLALAGDVSGAMPVDGIELIYDQRLTNLASLRVRGVDLQTAYTFDTGLGQFTLNASISGLLQYERFATPGAPGIALLDTIANPVDWRGRAAIAWRGGAWGASAAVNYVDEYTDTLTATRPEIAAWTTVDARLSYEWRTDDANRRTVFALSLQNLFDEDPPFANNAQGYGFDSANSSPIGRYAMFEIRSSW